MNLHFKVKEKNNNKKLNVKHIYNYMSTFFHKTKRKNGKKSNQLRHGKGKTQDLHLSEELLLLLISSGDGYLQSMKEY